MPPAALARRGFANFAKFFTRSCSLRCCGANGVQEWDEQPRDLGSSQRQRRTLKGVILNVRLYYGIAFGLSSIVNLTGLYGLWISDDKSYSNNITLLMGCASLICIIVYILHKYGGRDSPVTNKRYIPWAAHIFTLWWTALSTFGFTHLPLLPYKCQWQLRGNISRLWVWQCDVEVVMRGLCDGCIPVLMIASALVIFGSEHQHKRERQQDETEREDSWLLTERDSSGADVDTTPPADLEGTGLAGSGHSQVKSRTTSIDSPV